MEGERVMARYIEEENLIEEIKSLRITIGGKDAFPDVAKETVLRIINEQPTADVVKMAERQRKEEQK